MIDIEELRTRRSDYVAACDRRGERSGIEVDEVLALADRICELELRAEGLRVRRRDRSRSRDQASAESRRQQHKAVLGTLAQKRRQLVERLLAMPNYLDSQVASANDHRSNVVVRVRGDLPRYPFKPRSHAELGALCGMSKFVSRSGLRRSYFLTGVAVEFREALQDLFLEIVRGQGFSLVAPPWMANPDCLLTSGFAPFHLDQSFIEGVGGLTLIGTSEQAILGMHMNDRIGVLPKLYLGDSRCFRTEIGKSGRDTTGFMRVHEFHKVEQLVFCAPQDGPTWHAQCLENEEQLLRQLELPYRVVRNCTGDMSPSNYSKFDTEVWMPSELDYREMTSNVYLLDYQTRRGRIRAAAAGPGSVHTVSATAFCDRLIFAIWENFQQRDGSVRVPDVLVSRLGGQTLIEARTRDA